MKWFGALLLVGLVLAQDAKAPASYKSLSRETFQHARAIFAEKEVLDAKMSALQREYADLVTVECAAAGVAAADIGAQNCHLEPAATPESSTGRLVWVEKAKEYPK